MGEMIGETAVSAVSAVGIGEPASEDSALSGMGSLSGSMGLLPIIRITSSV